LLRLLLLLLSFLLMMITVGRIRYHFSTLNTKYVREHEFHTIKYNYLYNDNGNAVTQLLSQVKVIGKFAHTA